MPLQLGNGDHGYNNRAAGGASDTAAVEAEEDGAVKLNAEMAIAKKAAWKNTADEKAKKEEAEARATIEKAKALLAKKTREVKAATAKAGGDTVFPRSSPSKKDSSRRCMRRVRASSWERESGGTKRRINGSQRECNRRRELRRGRNAIE